MVVAILNVGRPDNEGLLQRAASNAAEYSRVHTLTDPAEAQEWAGIHSPDITVVDICQLNGRGIDFMQRFRRDPACAALPLLALVDERDRDHRHQALRAGADEFINAPLDAYECQVRMLNMLAAGAHRRRAQQPVFVADAELFHRIDAREREILLRLARAGEYRDETTGSHIVRIGKLSRGIAEALALDRRQCEIIEAAAPMHDIGKIGIPDAILGKPSAFTDQERAIMKTHTLIGYDILKNSSSPYVQCGAEIALAHHEKYDGSGYPYGIGGEDIPLNARIVAVADVYDALTSSRAYKASWPTEQVCEYMRAHSGTHFDPACVQALCSYLHGV